MSKADLPYRVVTRVFDERTTAVRTTVSFFLLILYVIRLRGSSGQVVPARHEILGFRTAQSNVQALRIRVVDIALELVPTTPQCPPL